ncbi:hypothetical protein M408DRAFT_14186 [Serendipita vermifera MAFF 305830]|uniref:Aminomethyltransferase folate-binding domain-containing protein n=1 Tax=Serendipita vermifera MAFF 305830 TaxID=933852 RepID=A0A0C3B9F3_SERVB|nr:hypothetical protein M408DRAFT_14186 [Serendipita vermifera MAFF 305830]
MATRLATRAVLAKVPNRAFLRVTGSNSAQLLNGLITTTIPWPPVGGFYSAFLAANGKMLYDVFLWPIREDKREGYLIEYDSRPSEAPPLAALLKKHVLRSKVRVEESPDEWEVWSAWGGNEPEASTRQWRHGSQGAVEPVWNDGITAWRGKDGSRIKDLRAMGMGDRIITRRGTSPDESQTHEPGSSEDYTVHRILHGVPEGSVELPALSALPLNSDLDLMGGIDFRKGCYVGQELTVRTYHTGVIRRRVFPVQIYPENESPREDATTDDSIPSMDPTPIKVTSSTSAIEREFRSSKLLVGLRGVGLAALRTPPPLTDGSDVSMHVETPSGSRYNVRPWIPTWWPKESITQGAHPES